MVLGGVGAASAQGEGVLAGAGIVGEDFERDANLRILGEPCGVGVQRGGRGAVQLIAVEGEEDAVGASLFHEVGHGTRNRGAGDWCFRSRRRRLRRGRRGRWKLLRLLRACCGNRQPRHKGEGKSLMRHSYNRSEEHTSELQSLMRISYAVFCLKKKKQTTNLNIYTQSRNQTR